MNLNQDHPLVTTLVDTIRTIAGKDSPPDTMNGRDKDMDDRIAAMDMLEALVDQLEEAHTKVHET